MSWWTEEQDDVLREVSFRGAAYAAAEIERRCGVAHSVRAVEMRASRIHCSLAIQTVCPQCGAVGVKINRQTGMCPLCTERYHLEQERAFNEQLERAAGARARRLRAVGRARRRAARAGQDAAAQQPAVQEVRAQGEAGASLGDRIRGKAEHAPTENDGTRLRLFHAFVT